MIFCTRSRLMSERLWQTALADHCINKPLKNLHWSHWRLIWRQNCFDMYHLASNQALPSLDTSYATCCNWRRLLGKALSFPEQSSSIATCRVGSIYRGKGLVRGYVPLTAGTLWKVSFWTVWNLRWLPIIVSLDTLTSRSLRRRKSKKVKPNRRFKKIFFVFCPVSIVFCRGIRISLTTCTAWCTPFPITYSALHQILTKPV